MLGASRGSMNHQVEVLEGRRSSAGFDVLAQELFSVADLLGREKLLRNALADAGQSEQARVALATEVFSSRVSELATQVLVDIIGDRWSTDGDLVLAIEELATQAAFAVADTNDQLDSTEEEIFLFGRAIDESSTLQMALTDPSSSAQTKAAIVRDLLAGRATAATEQVLAYTVGHLHGRRIDSVIENLCDLAARQRQRVVAEVRVARPLDADQTRRLADVLSRINGRTVRLNVAVDPSVLGGVYVKVGDEVIDGTIAAKLEQARRVVLG
ncbi:MAG TPA: F0F1 ATP synthase subunit delta [Actinobacteria bacterium]|nr:F0F1 ATP synthase subunit delta [Actinomycetota bacterium]